jgi:hypothetical protein
LLGITLIPVQVPTQGVVWCSTGAISSGVTYVTARLPKRLPTGTKYVVESAGAFVRRFLELPNGQRIALSKRKALICKCAETVSIVPNQAPEVSPVNDPRVAP